MPYDNYNFQMSLFGVELNNQVNRLITDIRLTLQKNKFIPNIRTIYRSFVQVDPQVSGALAPHLFQKALNQNGIFFKKVDLAILKKAFSNEKEEIVWFEFMRVLRMPMNEKRKNVVLKVYSFLAAQHDKLTQQNLIQHFDPSSIQVVKTKKVSASYVQEELVYLLNWQAGYLTEAEFVAFYDDLNVNFPHDEPFIKQVSCHWGFKAENDFSANEETLRSIIKALRFKLIQKSKGTNDQFLMRKLFDEFDENKNGYISAFELDLMLKKLELPIAPECVEPLFRKLDKNDSGNIEYDQFKRFLFFQPFPA